MREINLKNLLETWYDMLPDEMKSVIDYSHDYNILEEAIESECEYSTPGVYSTLIEWAKDNECLMDDYLSNVRDDNTIFNDLLMDAYAYSLRKMIQICDSLLVRYIYVRELCNKKGEIISEYDFKNFISVINYDLWRTIGEIKKDALIAME